MSLISFKEKDSVEQNQDQFCIDTQKSDLAETVLVSVGGYKPVNQLAQQQSLSIYLNGIEEIYQEALDKNCKPVQVLKGRLFPWQCSKVTRDFVETLRSKDTEILEESRI